MITTKTFNLGVHLWFIIHYEGDKVYGIEQHDWREGGSLPQPVDRDWTEDDFVKIVLGRFHTTDNPDAETAKKEADAREWVEKKVRQLLASDKTSYHTDKDPECPWYKK
jgi:hypothetical protein